MVFHIKKLWVHGGTIVNSRGTVSFSSRIVFYVVQNYCVLGDMTPCVLVDGTIVCELNATLIRGHVSFETVLSFTNLHGVTS
jgi:hypothetical protein